MTFAIFESNAVSTLIAILLLALVHLFVKELRHLDARSRNALLSLGAGASLAYVLLRILPKLAEKQEDLMAGIDTGVRGFLEHHAYLVAMVGLVVYYGISRIAAYGTEGMNSSSTPHYNTALIATIVGYGAYSMLIGYLIVNRLHFGLFSMALITFGMGTLFLVSDHGLYKKWPAAYERWIRWVLAIALVAGWAVGGFNRGIVQRGRAVVCVPGRSHADRHHWRETFDRRDRVFLAVSGRCGGLYHVAADTRTAAAARSLINRRASFRRARCTLK